MEGTLSCSGLLSGRCPGLLTHNHARMHCHVPFRRALTRQMHSIVSMVLCKAQDGAAAESICRRELFQTGLAGALFPLLLLGQPRDAHALGFTKQLKKRKASLDEYTTSSDGLKFYDLAVGSGAEVSPGKKVTVHFDCIYKGIDVVSSRQARLLGGNRTISEPFEFTAGEVVSGVAVKKISDSANGLFAGSGGPKPPPALGTAVLGMRTGGKRSIIVPPEVGYGDKGLQEIPPNGTFELQVEVLSVA